MRHWSVQALSLDTSFRVIHCSASLLIWAAGPGDVLSSPETAMERLEGQLREQTAGAPKAAVAELVRTGHVSAALQVF